MMKLTSMERPRAAFSYHYDADKWVVQGNTHHLTMCHQSAYRSLARICSLEMQILGQQQQSQTSGTFRVAAAHAI